MMANILLSVRDYIMDALLLFANLGFVFLLFFVLSSAVVLRT